MILINNFNNNIDTDKDFIYFIFHKKLIIKYYINN